MRRRCEHRRPARSSGGDTEGSEPCTPAVNPQQAAEIRACRGQGLPYREVVERESRPLIAAAVTDVIADFEASSTRFRQAKAAALREEGMTLEDIGRLFGVSRQRISGLLQAADSSESEP